MSSQMNTYVIAGVKLPFNYFDDRGDDEAYEFLEPYMDSAFKGIEHHNGLCVIYDGMCGKYIFAGRVLAKSNVYDGLPQSLDVVRALTPDLSAEVSVLLQDHLAIASPDVSVWALTHYR